MVLNNDKLLMVVGGGTAKNVGIGLIFAALGSFIVGIIDGFLRPLKCNVWKKKN